jgi:RHS repeat-associated protein
MKNIFAILLGVLFVGFSAQTTTPPTGASSTENYVYSRTYLEAVTTSSTTAKQVQGIQYFDGLGRPKQSIAIKASPLGRDVVTPIVYDGFGRQTREYLPIPQSSTTNGTIYTQNSGLVNYPVSDPTNIYASEKIYSEKVLENSPLDRVFQQVQPGNDWATKPINFDYQTNDSLEVKKYTITTTWTVANTDVYTTTSSLPTITTYADNTLYKNKVSDEDGNVSYEFKNGQGQTLLVRKVLSATQNADTYYVYNEYDQLALVIPPLASAKTALIQSDLDELCYQYRYDNQNRLVEKKLPGKGWEYMVYDQQDRLVLTQDAMLRGTTNNFTKRGWLFTKYDQFGRVVYTGFFANTATRETMQKSLNSMSSNAANNETRDNTGFAQNGLTVYYTKTAFPTGSMTILSVNYYDQYPSDLVTVPTSIQGETLLSAAFQTTEQRSTKSLPLASFVKNIDTDNWTKNYTFYDLKARAIGTHSYNYLGGYTKTESKLDFSGVPTETYTYHKRLSTDTEIVIKERFEYDNQNRLVKHWHNVNNAANDELLTFNEYNELGQLKNKKVGGNAGSPLQSVDYRYNVRGWMTGVNTNTDGSLQTNKLFNYRIFYNTLNPDFTGGTAKYNGNIAEITWKTNYANADDKIRNYSYEYDALNRLLSAKYFAKGTTNDQDYYNENLTYNLNGNIVTLKRYSNPPTGSTTAQKIDDLEYNYENAGYSNKLNKITLPVAEINNPSGYNALQNAISYDANGNMINQFDKNISSISYNFLNLPTEIVLPNSEKINYFYGADGTKIKKVRIINIGSSTATETTDYLNGFQYQSFSSYSENRSSKLLFFPTVEGYYSTDLENNPYNPKAGYVYNYTDHLGNVRLSYYKNSAGVLTILEENNYYPFGLKHSGYNNITGATPSYQYKYNGKELQETGMYDYGARFYMPDIGRWGVLDPLSELQFKHSPYTYTYNNPIFFNDPTGMIGEDPKPVPEFINGGKAKEIDEVVLTKATAKSSKESSISFTGINDLSAYYDARDHMAAAIRNSPAALATEKAEQNLANAMGTFAMGGSNIWASAGWSLFDTWTSYQDPEDQEAIAAVQLAVIGFQLKHGNVKGLQNLVDEVDEVAKVSGWVKKSVFKSLDPSIQKKVAAAIEKGIVAPTGKQGIIKLTASEAAQTGYQYKIKILGKGGDTRIYGNALENGHILFEKRMGH